MWAPEPVWRGGKEKNYFLAPAGKPLPVVQPVALSLHCLSYPCRLVNLNGALLSFI